MSMNEEAQNERSKAAAWAWYQRGASSSCAQPSGALLLKRRRRRNSFNNEDNAAAGRVLGISPLPSRFKREAAAAHYDQHLQATSPASPAEAHDEIFAAAASALALRLKNDLQSDHSYRMAAAGTSTTHCPLQNSSIDDLAPCFCSMQSPPATCRLCLPSRGSHSLPAALDHCAGYCNSMPQEPRRISASSPPASSRKSFSSSSVNSLGRICSPEHEQLDALMSLGGSFCGDQADGKGVMGAAAFYSSDSRSSLLDSFELCAVLKKFGYKIKPRDLERALSSSETETETKAVGNSQHNLSSPPAAHCKQSLYDLLGWSERGLDMKGGRCSNHEEENCSSDHFYHVESPEVNISSCSSSNCDAKAAAQVRQQRRQRPSILISQSFSNALHHIHLPTSFSNAFHHLPHSFSNTLHHLPQLPHSFSNALAHFTHSLSSAYQSLHVSFHRHNADEGIAPHPHIDNTHPNYAHNSHSPSASPDHHAHTHRNLFASSLRHFLSFKWHHSPLHPSCESALNGVSLAAKHRSNDTCTLAEHHLRSSPPFDLRGLSKSDDYMLIYSSVKKHSDYGSLSGTSKVYHYMFVMDKNDAINGNVACATPDVQARRRTSARSTSHVPLPNPIKHIEYLKECYYSCEYECVHASPAFHPVKYIICLPPVYCT